jgi:hypothetical protein
VSPEKGEIVLDCAIEPEALVPYYAAAYRSLGRQRYVLVNGPGERAVAELLDRWSVGRFDPSTQVLSLGVMRPASGLRMVPAARLSRWLSSSGPSQTTSSLNREDRSRRESPRRAAA